jgi:hypothetical protein
MMRDYIMSCPECGSEDFDALEYDFGRDPEAGYSDSGTRATCLQCGHVAGIEDFQRED